MPSERAKPFANDTPTSNEPIKPGPRVKAQDNSIGRNAEELVRKVEAALFVANHPGEVCPAKWKQGAETLKPSIDLVGKL